MNNTTVPINTLKVKLSQLDSQIKEKESQISKLREQRGHISYLVDNYQSIFGGHRIATSQQPMFQGPIYDQNMKTKELLVAILKNEGRKMDWNEVYAIFHKVKPKIKSSTMRVALSQMNKNHKYPVNLIKNRDEYKYLYGEK